MGRRITTLLALAALAGPVFTDEQRVDPGTAGTAGDAVLQPLEDLRIWSGDAPGSEAWDQEEVRGQLGGAFPNPIVRNVAHPTITPFLPAPETATGAAVIIAPGGGFLFLSVKSEGTDVARWLASKGIAAFVLKYRLIETPTPEDAFMQQLLAAFTGGGEGEGLKFAEDYSQQVSVIGALARDDALQAVRVVRSRSSEWTVDPARVGVLGFSAGAYVAMGAFQSGDDDTRPDFVAAIYGGALAPDAALSPDSPPVFVAVSADDPLTLDSTLQLVEQLRANKVSHEFHYYSRGGHGYGLNRQGLASDHWIEQFHAWLRDVNMLAPLGQ
jgi:acetyl esterase/lipase